jgi:uncharacterized repeat protein (TIGR01451 family)
MLSRNQRRRAGATAVLALLFIAACRDSVSERTTGLTPGKPSFAAGGSISVNLDQCANNVPRGGDCTWQNGDLNGNNSQYAEGLAIPFRLTIDGLKPGTQYQIHLNYDWTAGGHKAYDFLASDNATEQVDVCAAGGGGVPGACSSLGAAAETTFPENNFPTSLGGTTLSVTDAIAFAASAQGGGFVANGERKLKLYHGTIDGITDPTHTDNQGNAITNLSDLSGNTEADVLVTFTPTTSSVLFTWSAHLAQSAYWDGAGHPNGANEISGAPWHMRTQQLQTSGGASAGNKNQDRSIQPSAIIQPPAMDISKTADAATVNAGSTIGFTITVHNTGDGAADGFALSDPLPTGTGISWSIASQSGPVTCTISSGTLSCPSSGTASFPAGGTLAVHITSSTTSASCATYSNTATVSLTNGVGPSPATAQTTVQCPSLSISKTADAASVSAGSAIGFTITVSNAGPGTATSVSLSDALPTGTGVSWSISPAVTGCSITSNTLTCNFGDMASGASKTVHVTSSTTSESCKTYSNQASAQATNNAQVTSSASEDVICGEIHITKVADAATVSAGDQIGFVITVSNAGAGDVTSVAVTDTLPTQTGLSWSIDAANSDTGCSIASGKLTCSFGTLASGASKHVHITSSTTFASCATITNRAWVATGNDGSAHTGDNVVVQCPSLHITKTADAATVSAGSAIGFTIGVSNSGPGTAKSVTISDALPTGSGVSWSISPAVSGCSISGNPQSLSCTLGDMASGASVSVHVTSSTAFASCKAYANTAAAQATNHAQVTASATTTVQCPNLTISKTPDPSGTGYTLHPGGTAIFTITVTNTGTGTASNVVITDTLPVAPTPAWSDNKAECGVSQITVSSVTRDLLTCTIASLAPSASFTVQVSSAIPSNYLFQDPSAAGTPIEIDGDLIDGADAGKDWASLGISCTGTIVGCDLDRPTGTTDNSFGQGTKEDTPVPSVVFGSIPNNKSDLLRFYVSKDRFVTTDWLYLAWERVQAPKGTTNMDFELSQSDVLSANGVTRLRTAGDILIKYDLGNGGTNPVLGYHKWVTLASAGGQSPSVACEASNSFPCWGKVTSLVGSSTVAAAINTSSVDDPINPDATRTLDALTFGEARIDLEGSGIFQTGVCVNFGWAYLKSRSSDSFTSEIKDFIAPIRVAVSNCATKTLHNTAWAKADNFSPANGVSDTGDIEVTESQSASASVLAPTTRVASKAGTGMIGAETMSTGAIGTETVGSETIGTETIGTGTMMNRVVVTGVAASQPAALRSVVRTGDEACSYDDRAAKGHQLWSRSSSATDGCTASSKFMT